VLTKRDAQALQDDAADRGVQLAWLVSEADPTHPGQFTARAHTLDHHGGKYLPGALVADTLVDLRAQMPAGLTITPRTPWQDFYPDDIVEMWDYTPRAISDQVALPDPKICVLKQ